MSLLIRASGIAVLPFRSISRDTSDDYLADAITEEVASTLSSLGSLRVIAPASVGAYMQGQRTLRELGAAVRADALLEGDIQKAGDSVRVRVKLIDPHRGDALESAVRSRRE